MPTKLKDAALRHLFNMIHDFKTIAVHAESKITHYGLCKDSKAPVHEMEWRINREMWASIKEVSHFNLGTALELMLKMILLRKNKELKRVHSLAELYDLIPEKEQKKLNSAFDEIFKKQKINFVAAITISQCASKPNDDPFASMKDGPKQANGSRLKKFFQNFDKNSRLWGKRYAWEDVEKKEWRYYIDDISAFTELIDRVMADAP